jgi:small-conductance mechanosensitive channel
MLMSSKKRTAADYRAQAAHIREFLKTLHENDPLRSALLDVAARCDRLAEQQDHLRSLHGHPERLPRTIRAQLDVMLQDAQERAQRGERHIMSQKNLLTTLQRDGRNTRLAQRLLHTFEEIQKLREEHRDFLRACNSGCKL